MKLIAFAAVAIPALVVAACGGGSPSAAGQAASTPTSSAAPQVVTFHESEFKIDPATLSLKAGTYEFDFVDDGKFGHDFHLAPAGSTTDVAASSAVLKSGQSGSFVVTLKPGTYTYFCAVPGHKDRGMVGTLTVT
jgi:uncharacterized cupredoxin-like copper-binding protein